MLIVVGTSKSTIACLAIVSLVKRIEGGGGSRHHTSLAICFSLVKEMGYGLVSVRFAEDSKGYTHWCRHFDCRNSRICKFLRMRLSCS